MFVASTDLRSNDFLSGSLAIISGAQWELQRKRGRGQAANHQGDVQALSHYRAFILIMGKDLTTKTDRLHPRFSTRNLTENSYQSKTIIGAVDGPNNLSEGYRTTRVISVT